MSSAGPLRRFWFPTASGLGIGVTAPTRNDAERLAREAALKLKRELDLSAVVEDVDVRTLDQRHVVPNMGIVSNAGVWFPQGAV